VVKRWDGAALQEANLAALLSYLKAGIAKVQVLADDDSCAECKALAKSPMKITEATVPPFHEGCRCAIAAVVD
jgi:hypothetical protein